MKRDNFLQYGIGFFMASIIMLISYIAYGQPGDLVNITETGDKAVAAAASGEYLLLVACGVMCAVWILQRFVWPAIQGNKKVLPWIAVAIGLMSGFGTSIINGSGWIQGLINAALMATSAMGQYSLFGKRVLPNKKDV